MINRQAQKMAAAWRRHDALQRLGVAEDNVRTFRRTSDIWLESIMEDCGQRPCGQMEVVDNGDCRQRKFYQLYESKVDEILNTPREHRDATISDEV